MFWDINFEYKLFESTLILYASLSPKDYDSTVFATTLTNDMIVKQCLFISQKEII